jgi:hypothetical protein
MHLVEIRPGRFMMGSPASEVGRCDNETQHEVAISKAFWLGQTPVTQVQWEAVMGTQPSYYCGNPNHPVEKVSWQDATAFCRCLSEATGMAFRLPTEAEWEYACRAGTAATYSFGDDPSSLGENAWFEDNSGGSTNPVAMKKSNRWGLYDMHGNVWEWCSKTIRSMRRQTLKARRAACTEWCVAGAGSTAPWRVEQRDASMMSPAVALMPSDFVSRDLHESQLPSFLPSKRRSGSLTNRQIGAKSPRNGSTWSLVGSGNGLLGPARGPQTGVRDGRVQSQVQWPEEAGASSPILHSRGGHLPEVRDVERAGREILRRLRDKPVRAVPGMRT